jgi:hypothetical protein
MDFEEELKDAVSQVVLIELRRKAPPAAEVALVPGKLVHTPASSSG